jgi:hypothetical protein
MHRQKIIRLPVIIGTLLALALSLPVKAAGTAGGKTVSHGHAHGSLFSTTHAQTSRTYRIRQGFALESGTPGHAPLHARKPRRTPPEHFHRKPFKHVPAQIVYWQQQPAPRSGSEPEHHGYDFARPFSYFQERAELYLRNDSPE